MAFIEPQVHIRDLLRNRIADPNPSRSVIPTGGRAVNWIFDDFPREDIQGSSFPRIGIEKDGETQERLGFRESVFWNRYTLTMRVLAKQDQLLAFPVGNTDGPGGSTLKHEGAKLARRITRESLEVLRKFTIPDLVDAAPNSQVYFGYRVTGLSSLELDDARKIWSQDTTFEISEVRHSGGP